MNCQMYSERNTIESNEHTMAKLKIVSHYENTPIQIYRKIPKTEYFQTKKTSLIFHISAKNIDFGYALEPPRRGGSNESHSMF